MKKLFLAVIILFAASTCFAQTKMVAHRSHSGKNAGFTINGIDNLGETPAMVEEQKKFLDSLRRADSIKKADSPHGKKQPRYKKQADSIKADTTKGSLLPAGDGNYMSAALQPVAQTGIANKENKTMVLLFWVISFVAAILVVFEFSGKKQPRHAKS